MKKLTEAKRSLTVALQQQFGNIVTRQQTLTYLQENGIEKVPNWLFNTKAFRAGRGQYNLTAVLALGDSSSGSSNSGIVIEDSSSGVDVSLTSSVDETVAESNTSVSN